MHKIKLCFYLKGAHNGHMENMPKSLVKRREKRLKREGFPSDDSLKNRKIKQQMVPIEGVGNLSQAYDEEIEALVSKYMELSPRMRNSMVKNLKARRNAGSTYEELERDAKILAKGNLEFKEMPTNISDKIREEKPTDEDEKLRKELEDSEFVGPRYIDLDEMSKRTPPKKDWKN